MSSNRYGEANSVYKNAQARNEDFKKMEKALADLCELFTQVCPFYLSLGQSVLTLAIQLASMVEQQDDTLNAIITTAQTIEKDTEAGCVLPRVVFLILLTFYLVSNKQRKLLSLRVLPERSAGSASSSSLSFLSLSLSSWPW